MLEKLLENWLDSASERSYQQAFVQMLSADGFRVVHSTRHAALEFGKDILAIAGDGVGCAYQLKGNPGGRLGLAQFRDLQPQLVQMMTQAIVYPGFPTGRHRSYLVSNGFFDEEVQRAADDLNRMGYPSPLSLISRGALLDSAKSLGVSLWPSELKDTQLLLQLFLADPKDMLPVALLSDLLTRLFRLDDTTQPFRKAEYSRAVTSAALLTGIATANFTEQENHLAVAYAWSLFLVSAFGALERSRLQLSGGAAGACRLAEIAVADALIDLMCDVQNRENLVEGDPVVDSLVYDWRSLTVLGAMSCLATMEAETARLPEEQHDFLKKWLLRFDHRTGVWGEAAVANIVPWLVWLRGNDATSRPDYQILALADFVISSNQRKSNSPLANPYYSYTDIMSVRLGLKPPIDDSFAGHSHTALLLLYYSARTNLKDRCVQLWPAFSHLHHRAATPTENWEYCKLSIESGIDEVQLFPPQYGWDELRANARLDCRLSIPFELAKRPWLLAMWWQIAPQRLNPDASRVFANALLPDWGL